MIKVLCLTKESSGGLGEFLNQLHLIKKSGFLIDYLLYSSSENSTFNQKALILEDNYPRHPRFTFNKMGILIRNILITNTHILKTKPDILFACDLYSIAVITVLKLLRKSKIKTIIHININIVELISSKKGYLFKKILDFIVRKVIRVNDLVVCVSEGLSKYLQSYAHLNSAQVVVINSAVSQTKKSLPKKISKNKLHLIVTAGRLGWPKDYYTVIDALSLLPQKEIELYLIGDGPDRAKIQSYARKKGVGSRVRFLGWQKNVKKILTKAEIFIFSSLSDAFPRVLLEALAVRLPIIATDCNYGPREILNGGEYGILVPVSNPTIMAQQIEFLLENKKEQFKLSRKAVQRAAFYNLTGMIDRYKKIFTALAEQYAE